MWRLMFATMLLVVTNAAMAGDDTDMPPQVTAYLQRQETLKENLRRSADPRDWALASQIYLFHPSVPQDDDVLMSNAAAAAPDDVLVQWWAAHKSIGGEGQCGSGEPRPDLVAALHAVDGENGAVWLIDLDSAISAKDESAIDAALTHIAAAPRFNFHISDATQAWLHAYERFGAPAFPGLDEEAPATARPPSAVLRVSMANSQAMSSMPGLSGLRKTCKLDTDTTGQNWQRASLCESVGRLMAGTEDSLLTTGMGLAIIRQAGREQEEDRRRGREMEWLRESVHDVDKGTPGPWTVYAETLARSGSEIKAIREALRHAGLATRPPADWLPRSERVSPDQDVSEESESAYKE